MLGAVVLLYLIITAIVWYHGYLVADEDVKQELVKNKLKAAFTAATWPLYLAKLLFQRK